jgi:hypothetical protein
MGCWIPKNVYVSIGDGAVFLDVHRDRYVGVAAAQIRGLSEIVEGWPAFIGSPVPEAAHAGADVGTVVNSLVAQGLLTHDRRLGKRVTRILLPRPEHPIVADSDLQKPVSIRARHVIAFANAYFATVLTLRGMSLSCALTSLTRLCARRASNRIPASLQLTRGLVLAFKRLRLLFYTARSECLFDSIVMLRFLSSHGIRPTFVIGISSPPFCAHCWLQVADVVLNSEPAYTQRFSPILTI